MTRNEQTIDEILRELGATSFKQGGGGTPRVPETMPVILGRRLELLLQVRVDDRRHPLASIIEGQVMSCHDLTYHLQAEVCGHIRTSIADILPAIGEVDRMTWASRVRGRLERGELPFASSEVLPVYGGAMEVRPRFNWSIDRSDHERLIAWIESVKRDYESLSYLGPIATDWMRQIRSLARQVYPIQWR